MNFPKRLKIHGEWWRIVIGDVPQAPTSRSRRNVGLCDYQTRTIWISKRLSTGGQATTLIHELIHASIPNAPEKQVLAAEKAICSTLNRMLDA